MPIKSSTKHETRKKTFNLPPHVAFHNGRFSLRSEGLAGYIWIDILYTWACEKNEVKVIAKKMGKVE